MPTLREFQDRVKHHERNRGLSFREAMQAALDDGAAEHLACEKQLKEDRARLELQIGETRKDRDSLIEERNNVERDLKRDLGEACDMAKKALEELKESNWLNERMKNFLERILHWQERTQQPGGEYDVYTLAACGLGLDEVKPDEKRIGPVLNCGCPGTNSRSHLTTCCERAKGVDHG